jgi:nucleoid-associated protein YgaU
VNVTTASVVASVAARLSGALAVLAAVAALLWRASPSPSGATTEARVVALATLAAFGCVAWLAVVLVVVACGSVRLAPTPLRAVAARVLGVAAAGVVSGALVAAPASADGPFDRPAPSPPHAPRARPPSAVVVAPGDTLWGIAARRLGIAASPGLTAATWPRWYVANRPVVGPDPGRILPGQRLVPPNDGGRG